MDYAGKCVLCNANLSAKAHDAGYVKRHTRLCFAKRRASLQSGLGKQRKDGPPSLLRPTCIGGTTTGRARVSTVVACRTLLLCVHTCGMPVTR